MRLLLVSCLSLSCGVAAAAPMVPKAIEAPAGTVLIGTYPAKGVQIYRCSAVEGGHQQWVLRAPDADLTDGKGVFAHHSAGPTWRVPNGAKVVGKVIAKSAAPRSGSVAWLLLSATTTGAGPLAGTRFVQRIDTAGGAEPGTSCSTLGAEQRVSYAADYAFYR